MKNTLQLLFACSIAMLAILFALYEPTWECTAKVVKGIAINTQIDTSGALIPESYYSVAQSPYQFNLRGDGNYNFRFSDNVRKIVLWSGRTKLYDGPPIATFNVGKGMLGIDIHAEESAFVEASSRCSIGSFVKSFF